MISINMSNFLGQSFLENASRTVLSDHISSRRGLCFTEQSKVEQSVYLIMRQLDKVTVHFTDSRLV